MTEESKNFVQETIHDEGEKGWETVWKAGKSLWDTGVAAPTLVRLEEEGKIKNGNILIPGCGSCYEAFVLVSPGRNVLGVDISETAVEVAKEKRTEHSISESQVHFECTNFFELQHAEEFDVIFDYTFFCAIPPDYRPRWGQKMKELLKPDGDLITLLFPVVEPPYEGGPPYCVNFDMYKEVLEPAGFECVEFTEVSDSIPQRKGLEYLAVWKKKQQS